MAIQAIEQTDKRLRFEVPGSRRPSTYFFAVVLTMGGLGFLLAGLSPFVDTNLLPFTDTRMLTRIPQGVAMIFYGVLALLASAYYWMSLVLNLGAGYNEFDKDKNLLSIYRSGFPGKNRHIKFTHDLDKITGLKVEIKGGLNPSRSLFLKIRGANNVRLSPIGQPPSLMTVEDQAAAVARFLNIGIEGI